MVKCMVSPHDIRKTFAQINLPPASMPEIYLETSNVLSYPSFTRLYQLVVNSLSYRVPIQLLIKAYYTYWVNI